EVLDTAFVSDDGILQGTVRAARDLNERAQPSGYAVTMSAGGEVGTKDPQSYRRFTVHRIDKPVASGPSFATAAEVESFLDAVEKLPRWRLDLDDGSITFDNTELTVTDVRTGESFCLKGWTSLGVTGRATHGGQAGAYDGARHISIATDEPPTIGRWYKSDMA
ncbi:hypothetical protein, partial [Mycobacterium avium]